MKTKTYLILKDELRKHPYSTIGEYDIESLFKLYTETEVTNFKDLFNKNIPIEFKQFVQQHIDEMTGIPRDEHGCIDLANVRFALSLAHKKCLPFSLLNDKLFEPIKKNQEDFTYYIEKLVGTDKLRILDVGSGQIPYSSILLAHDNMGEIDTMDKFTISNKSISNLNCTPHDEYFGSKTSVHDYDLVVANRACSAIEHIVANCVAQKRPYLIKLCACNAPDGTIESWEDYLRAIDPQISYAQDDYAYDLDL